MNDPGPAWDVWPSQTTVNVPSRIQNDSSSLWWMCIGGEKPAANRTSISPNDPPVLCAVALTVIRVPRNQVAPPSSGPTTNGWDPSRIASDMTSSCFIMVADRGETIDGTPASHQT